tara:strand:- start:76 stop:471 length:396 start_codon:yes stop_codon:yes gene_type:complete
MKIKEKLWSFLLKNSTTIYVFMATVIIAAALLFVQEIKHSSEMLKSHIQGLGVLHHLEQQVKDSKEKDEFIDFQSEIVYKLRSELEKASETLGQQESILRQLIDYLKRIERWPPKTEPIDPNSIARAGSEA